MTSFTGTMFEMGATPALERAMDFAELRHRKILSNVANADTPGYRRQDLDENRFERALSEAIEARDRRHPGWFGMRDGSVTETRFLPRGFRTLGSDAPFPGTDGPLRHDENNVSIEREMALLAKNSGAYSRYAALLRKAFLQMRAAISGQPGQS